MNRNNLKLSLQADDDGTGELIAEVSANGFGGKGSAWFDLQRLVAFSEELLSYPIAPEKLPKIEGGFWSKEKKGILEQVHFLLKIYPIGSTGKLGAKIRVATPRYESDRCDSQHIAEVEIETDYNALESFAGQLKQLAKLERSDATLNGVEV